METYKIDMMATLEHLAKQTGIPTSYEDLTPSAREKKAKVASTTRSRKRALHYDDAEGPPDKKQHFSHDKPGICLFPAFVSQHLHATFMFVTEPAKKRRKALGQIHVQPSLDEKDKLKVT